MSETERSEGKDAVRKQRSYIPKTLLVVCKADYIQGKGSIREIAELYNVSHDALAARCSRDNWRCDSEKVVKKVIETVKRVELSRLDLLRSHEDEMVLRMKKRLKTVDKSLEQVGDLVEPQELRAIVSTESVIDQVMRRSLGAEEKLAISGSISLDIVSILERIRAKPITIDAEAIETELTGCKIVD